MSYRDGKTESRKPILSVDFDGVIHGYKSGWTGPVPTDSPVPGAKEAIERLRCDWHVVVFSTRAHTEDGLGVQHIAKYLDDYGIVVDDIVKEKPRATVQIDDRAFRFEGDWDEVEEFLADFENTRPWNKKRKHHEPAKDVLDALCLMDSMIRSGEQHSSVSLEMLERAKKIVRRSRRAVSGLLEKIEDHLGPDDGSTETLKENLR